MTVTLRPYQTVNVADVHAAWNNGAQNVVDRMDTGAGKTAVLSYIHANHAGASVAMAHRQELVGQLSHAFARYGVHHNLIAADATKRAIARSHVEEYGKCFYMPGAPVAIASVDTLIRATGLDAWAAQVTLWTCDEAHHLVRGNKWSAAIDRFTSPHVRGLMPTATPGRADGKGLGRHADGYADAMVEGPPMRWLIDNGWLTDYRIVCPTSDLEILVEPGESGDWSTQQLREAAKRSHIVGDVVREYLKWSRGLLHATFCTDVETATETTAAFRAAGVRAELLTGKTADHVRRDMLRRFAARQIDELVTVDIISEGFDLPGLEAISLARPTNSYPLYAQQFGRPLRLWEGKGKALIIDHVSNTVRHQGPPDRPRDWTLDRRGKRAKRSSDAVPYRICLECIQPYERSFRCCPFCGHYPEPQGRGTPAAVDGDMGEMDPALLAKLRGAVEIVDATEGEERARLSALHMPDIGVRAGVNRHRERSMSQATLRASMAQWGGIYHALGYDDSRIQRLFWHVFGLDVLTAQALKSDDANALRERVDAAVTKALTQASLRLG